MNLSRQLRFPALATAMVALLVSGCGSNNEDEVGDPDGNFLSVEGIDGVVSREYPILFRVFSGAHFLSLTLHFFDELAHLTTIISINQPTLDQRTLRVQYQERSPVDGIQEIGRAPCRV